MGISMNGLCYQCLINKNVAITRSMGDPQAADALMKDLLKLLAEAPADANSSMLGAQVNALYGKHFHLDADRFVEEKRESNAFVLARLPQLMERAKAQEDPVFAALQLAILGNYLDFSALRGQVSYEKLEKMLEDALDMELDREAYEQFRKDLGNAKTLLYVTDNAGEIGFDRILAELLRQAYPQLKITFCVRGGPAHNDALREDAAYMGIRFPVIDTGNDVGGVELSLLGPEAKAAISGSDVILTKGMGNVETLWGSGLPIYYAFLIKCPRFVEVFQKPHMTPMFIKESTP